MTTMIPDTPDIATPALNGKVDDVKTQTPTVIDFSPAKNERLALFDRLPERWELIAGLVGASVALATTATVVANVVARRRVEPRRIFGVRPIRRFGLRHVETPRGGTAWIGYIYRTPDLRVRLPIRK
jgi:hypothetical protein